jgi:hypothetical protein
VRPNHPTSSTFESPVPQIAQVSIEATGSSDARERGTITQIGFSVAADCYAPVLCGRSLRDDMAEAEVGPWEAASCESRPPTREASRQGAYAASPPSCRGMTDGSEPL